MARKVGMVLCFVVGDFFDFAGCGICAARWYLRGANCIKGGDYNE